MRFSMVALLAVLCVSFGTPTVWAQDEGAKPVPVTQAKPDDSGKAGDGEKPDAAKPEEGRKDVPADIVRPKDDGQGGSEPATEPANASPETLAVTDAPDDARDPVQRDLSAYRLRVGDTVDVVVYDHPEFSRPYPVPANGQILLHPIGKIMLRDQTIFEIEAEVRERLRTEEILTDPRVSVIVTSYSPRNVFLTGAVQAVVPLPTHKNVRILQLLAMAGGLGNPAADFSRVRIRRAADDGSAYTIDISVSDILERNDEQKNIIVFEGDYIRVPFLEAASPLSAEWVYVLGKVGSPGRIALTKGRTGFTLTKLIAMAGDFQEFANRSKVTLIRKTDTGRIRTVIDFDEIIEGERPDVDLQPDDLIYVPENFF